MLKNIPRVIDYSIIFFDKVVGILNMLEAQHDRYVVFRENVHELNNKRVL